MAPKAVVLVSGGLDSAVTAAEAVARGFEVHALSVHYGQRHDAEIEAARAIAASVGCATHREISVDLASFGGSSLTDPLEVLPLDRPAEAISRGIPSTYVPARNTVLLSLALSLAEALGARDLFLGVNSVDFSGYPDCRPAFLEAFERLASVATKAGVEGEPFRVHAPLVLLRKSEIVLRGRELGVDLALTRSCYDLDRAGRACGHCDSCGIRRRGFEEAGVPDPTDYQ
ncbi:MAG: 7-cyano-7-deazaguanine synthase QueC [Planctomycetaceae bacterium]|nr:7-cyano-7-deazaguanine synthase QueC [Planctomycetota bacterium]NUN53581.1 7-cyano-7-deazaguanine synthase QueC [Planctomycetaceae bacterium]